MQAPSRIELIASKHAIHPAKSWAHAYAMSAELFTISGVFYNGFSVIKEAVENGNVVYSIFPKNNEQAKLYFIF